MLIDLFCGFPVHFEVIDKVKDNIFRPEELINKEYDKNVTGC